MKNLLFAFFTLLFVTTGFAKKHDDKIEILTKEGTYEEVVQLQGASQEEIFKRAKSWIIENMKTDDNNILFDEKDYSMHNNGLLKIDEKTGLTWIINSGVTNFKFHVWAKDGRYKFRVDNVVAHLIVQSTGIAPKTILYAELEDNKMGNYVKGEVNKKMASFIQTFKTSMEKPMVSKSDW